MITAIVRFKLPGNHRCRQGRRVVPGLGAEVPGPARSDPKILYCSTPKAGPAAAAICGKAADAAERVDNAEWRRMIADRYGAAPEISYFETPVVVDNTLGKTILDAAE